MHPFVAECKKYLGKITDKPVKLVKMTARGIGC